MAVQLDPRFPVIWRDPATMQIGVDEPRIVLRNVSQTQERIVAALVAGAARPSLEAIARPSPLGLSGLDSLLERLAPALAPGEPTERARVLVVGEGMTATRLANGLAASGLRVLTAATAAEAAAAEPALAVAIGHYVLAPALYSLWLRRDVPHLAVVYGDRGARLSPVVEPGDGPCLYCIERVRADADPAWPALMPQLWGRRSGVETPLFSGEVAAMAARLATRRLAGHIDPHTARTIAEGEGRWREASVQTHPSCTCTVLDAELSAGAAPRGTDSAGEAGPGTGRSSTTTTSAAGARG